MGLATLVILKWVGAVAASLTSKAAHILGSWSYAYPSLQPSPNSTSMLTNYMAFDSGGEVLTQL